MVTGDGWGYRDDLPRGDRKNSGGKRFTVCFSYLKLLLEFTFSIQSPGKPLQCPPIPAAEGFHIPWELRKFIFVSENHSFKFSTCTN